MSQQRTEELEQKAKAQGALNVARGIGAMPQKPEECECCQFKTEALKFYESQHGSDREPRDSWYCDLCATTMASVMTRYYSQYSTGERHIMQAICYVGNAIIKSIKESRNAT